MELRFYYGDPDELDGMSRDEVIDATIYETELEDRTAEALTEIYGTIKVGECEFDAGDILKNCDPIAFRCTVADMWSEVDMSQFGEDDEDDEDDEE